MSFYILIPLLLLAIVIVTDLVKEKKLRHYSNRFRNGIIFLILTIPVMLLLIKADHTLQVMQDSSIIVKGIFVGLMVLLIDSIIFILIKRIKL